MAVVGLVALWLAGCVSWKDRFLQSSVVQSRQYTLQGLEAADQGDDTLATEYFAKAVETCPDSGEARQHYADALWRQGRHPEAIAQLTQAVQKNPDDVDRLLRLGEMHLALGRVDVANELASRGRSLDRNRAEVWRLEGDAHAAAGRAEDALASYHRALALRSHFPDVQLAVAKLYLAAGRPQRALATAESLASGLTPESEPADLFVIRGLAYRALDRPGRAIEEFRLACQRGGPNPEVEVLLAQAYEAAGDRIHAELVLRGTVTRSPQFAVARTMLDRLTDGNRADGGTLYR